MLQQLRGGAGGAGSAARAARRGRRCPAHLDAKGAAGYVEEDEGHQRPESEGPCLLLGLQRLHVVCVRCCGSGKGCMACTLPARVLTCGGVQRAAARGDSTNIAPMLAPATRSGPCALKASAELSSTTLSPEPPRSKSSPRLQQGGWRRGVRRVSAHQTPRCGGELRCSKKWQPGQPARRAAGGGAVSGGGGSGRGTCEGRRGWA